MSSQISFLLKDVRAFNSPCKASQTQKKELNTSVWGEAGTGQGDAPADGLPPWKGGRLFGVDAAGPGALKIDAGEERRLQRILLTFPRECQDTVKL